ncbi:Leucine-rich repeat-containing protein [Entamoeba marina]
MEEDKPNVDYYAVLKVDKSCTPEELRKSYLKLSLQYHPDKNPNDQEMLNKFHELQEAYKILKDPSQRYIYDEFGTKSRKEINEEAMETDVEDDKVLTVDDIVQAMKAMGIVGNEEMAGEVLINSNFSVNERVVRKGGLVDEFKRANEMGVTDIDLSKLVIRGLKDESIPHMSLLTSLNMKINSLRSLPTSFSTLTNLRKLDLSDNKFTEFPQQILSLTELSILEFERNQITELPDTIFQLSKLKRLNLFSNKLRNVPIRLCFDLPFIQSIDISCNFISKYPTHKAGVDLITDKDIATDAKQGSLVAQYFAQLDQKSSKKPKGPKHSKSTSKKRSTK